MSIKLVFLLSLLIGFHSLDHSDQDSHGDYEDPDEDMEESESWSVLPHVGEHEELPEDWEEYFVPDIEAANHHMMNNHSLFQGDVMRVKSTAGLKGANRWLHGIVPYVIARTYNSAAQKVIKNAMAEIESKSCVKFVERSKQEHYISFETGSGCSSYVGRINGKQLLTLQADGCIDHGIIIHELLHALGFEHEQSRSDRDQFVRIIWNNIQQGTENNFELAVTDNLESAYDFGSIMHYEPFAFAINPKKPTIMFKVKKTKCCQQEKLSPGDIININKYYECEKGVSGAKTSKYNPRTVGKH